MFSMVLSLTPANSVKASLQTNELLVSITQTAATIAESGNRFTAGGGVFAAVSELTAWDNNQQITIGGTGRTPIVINNAALIGAADVGWKPASVAGINNASAFQIKFSTLGYEDIRFSCTQKSTGSGPDAFRLAYRIGSTGTFTPIDNSLVNPVRVSNDSYTALEQTYYNFKLPVAVENQSIVELRVYFDGLGNLGRNGNTSINDIMITSGDYDFGSPNMPPDRLPRPEHIIINQVYGGGTGGAGAVSNSFIELYNPTNSDIPLAGKTLQYMKGIERGEGTYGSWQSLPLIGSIPANSSFLIISSIGVSANARIRFPTQT